jgi:hypothetical protein
MLLNEIEIGHEYHVVELNSHAALPQDLVQWLNIHCIGRYLYKHPKIYFYNQKDHMMFLLKCS